MTQLIFQPEGGPRLGERLNANLANHEWDRFHAAIAFVKLSGVRHIRDGLSDFSRRASVKIAVGIDCRGTSIEGLLALFAAVGDRGEIWVFHNENSSTFHPKLYLFRNDEHANLIVGSGNLTSGGLFTNYEASIEIAIDLADPAGNGLVRLVEETLQKWMQPNDGTAHRLDIDFLRQLIEKGYVVPESQARAEEEGSAIRSPRAGTAEELPLFTSVPVRGAPRITARTRQAPPVGVGRVIEDARTAVVGFLMTLQQTDAGVGQVHRGTARRSPEIFIPLKARNYAPSFWGWPDEFVEDTTRFGKFDRHGVRMRIGADTIEVNMMTWPVKHDFRLRSERLRSAGNVGDIIKIERAGKMKDYSYYVEIIPQGSSQYDYFLSLCENAVPNSDKRWGYYQ